MLENIIKNNPEYLSEEYKKADSGFTNSIYIFDNQFILKICTDEKNESNFLNEINFYKENRDNKYIPHVYKYNNITKPYYIIIEKLDGISLYNIWYKLNNNERERIIKDLTECLKGFHSHKRESQNWENLMIAKALNVTDKVRQYELLDESILKTVENIIKSAKEYLISDSICMIHGDIHFDNIFYTPNREIKIIDFETSSYAPVDYELDILLRMCRNPKKYANEITEDYVELNDYYMIPIWFQKYYPEIFQINNLAKRLLFYDLYYNLKLYTKHVNDNEIKETILNIIKKIKED